MGLNIKHTLSTGPNDHHPRSLRLHFEAQRSSVNAFGCRVSGGHERSDTFRSRQEHIDDGAVDVELFLIVAKNTILKWNINSLHAGLF